MEEDELPASSQPREPVASTSQGAAGGGGVAVGGAGASGSDEVGIRPRGRDLNSGPEKGECDREIDR